jgi:hypothetical protein
LLQDRVCHAFLDRVRVALSGVPGWRSAFWWKIEENAGMVNRQSFWNPGLHLGLSPRGI